MIRHFLCADTHKSIVIVIIMSN